jgi:hypothetical protein
VALGATCRLRATRLTAGERSDTETVTLRTQRGDWKRAILRWYLAIRLLNFEYPFRLEHQSKLQALPFLGIDFWTQVTSSHGMRNEI